jgi:hypothetical protein
LIITSTQWSGHKRAVEGNDGWQGNNQVLPGGATYFLANGERLPEVRVETWQTIMDNKERSALSESLGSNVYTLNTAIEEHDKIANNLKDSLEGLKVVQWVNGDHKATNAWTGSKAVKVEGGGVSLTRLGLNNKTSNEKKHYLTGTEGASSPYLDVMGSLKNDNIYFKIFADTQGNIYLSYSTSIEALKNATGDNPYISSATTEKILGKEDGINKLECWALEIETKTKAITNFLRVLERNAGSDPTAEWVNDGKWFNEAWDGIYLVKQMTSYSIGFNDPEVRAAALDPNLTPKSRGKRDMLTKAFLSQFRVEAPNSISIGSFKGRSIQLEGLNGILETKKFYIPNITVQDLDL